MSFMKLLLFLEPIYLDSFWSKWFMVPALCPKNQCTSFYFPGWHQIRIVFLKNVFHL